VITILNQFKIVKEEKNFFTPRYFFGRDKLINICVGNRGTGKSSAWLTYLVRHAITKQREIAFVLRLVGDIDEYKSNKTAFTNVEKLYKDLFNEEIILRQKKDVVYLVEYEEREEIEGEDKNKYIPKEILKQPILRMFALAKYDKYKSKDYSNIDFIFMDEFQAEARHGMSCYIGNEPEKLMNLTDTISRGFGEAYRQTRIILCSNFVDLYNPYYLYFGIINDIDPNLQSQRFCKEDVCYELHYIPIDKGRFGKFVKNTDYGKYALGNQARKVHRQDVLRGLNPSILRPYFAVQDKKTYITFNVFEFAKEKSIYVKRTQGTSTPVYKDLAAKQEVSKLKSQYIDFYYDDYETKTALQIKGIVGYL